MPVVELSETEWQQVMAIIATAPWTTANPLLMKIGDQLRQQHKQGPDSVVSRDSVMRHMREAQQSGDKEDHDEQRH